MRTWTMLGMGALAMAAAALLGSAAPAGDDERASAVKGPSAGLVAYYPFDGDAKDASGNGNDGEASGDVKYVDGIIGKAVRFGGVDSPGHLRVADSKTLKLGDVMSVSFWVRVEDDASATWMDGSGKKVPLAGQVVVAKSGDRTGIVIKRGEEGDGLCGLDVTAHAHSDHAAGAYSKEAIGLHEWIHIVVIAGKGGTRIYQGGELAAQDKTPVNLAEVNGEDMYVGIQAGKESNRSWWGPLNGAVDELRIYNRELTADEVKALAKRG